MTNTDDSLPLPIVETGSLDVPAGLFEAGEPTPYTPLGTVFLWCNALDDVSRNRTALDTLSCDPAAWGDYSEAASLIDHLSLLTDVHDCPEDEAIKYIRFIEYAGETNGQAIEDAALDEFLAITVVNPEGQPYWLVWGISENRFPSRSEVRLP